MTADQHPSLAYLARLQAEAREYARANKGKSPGFHYDLGMWVDDKSAAAKVLRAFAEERQERQAEIDASYSAYDEQPLNDQEDKWSWTPESLHAYAMTLLAPSMWESWLDGYNQTLGARPRDVMALGDYERVLDALWVEEGKAWGS